MGYSEYLYVRIVNPGTKNEYLLTGTEPGDVDATQVGDNDIVLAQVARYTLAGMGSIHFAAPMYVEET